MNGPEAEVKLGNTLPMSKIPVGASIHNIEMKPGKGGQLVRSAGNVGQLMAKEGKYATVKLLREMKTAAYRMQSNNRSDW